LNEGGTERKKEKKSGNWRGQKHLSVEEKKEKDCGRRVHDKIP